MKSQKQQASPQVRYKASFEDYFDRIRPDSPFETKIEKWNRAVAWEEMLVSNAVPHLVGTLKIPTKNAHTFTNAGAAVKRCLDQFMKAIHHQPPFKCWRDLIGLENKQQHIVYQQSWVYGNEGQPHTHWVAHFEKKVPSPAQLKAAFEWFKVIYQNDKIPWRLDYCEKWKSKGGLVRYGVACHIQDELPTVLCTRKGPCRKGPCTYFNSLQVD